MHIAFLMTQYYPEVQTRIFVFWISRWQLPSESTNQWPGFQLTYVSKTLAHDSAPIIYTTYIIIVDMPIMYSSRSGFTFLRHKFKVSLTIQPTTTIGAGCANCCEPGSSSPAAYGLPCLSIQRKRVLVKKTAETQIVDGTRNLRTGAYTKYPSTSRPYTSLHVIERKYQSQDAYCGATVG